MKLAIVIPRESAKIDFLVKARGSHVTMATPLRESPILLWIPVWVLISSFT